MSGEQDISKMGALRKKLPITFFVFLIGTLAISGIPPLAGFFSKDEILAKVWIQEPILFTVLAVTSILTAIYMFRLLFLTFYGNFRGTHEQEHHLHESPKVMTVPLVILAILSAFGGFLGIPHLFGGAHLFNNYLDSVISFPEAFINREPSHLFEWTMIIVSIIVLTLIIILTYRRYAKNQSLISNNEKEQSVSLNLAFRKFFVDEVYEALFVKPLTVLSNFFYRIVDVKLIDGIVNMVSKGVVATSGVLRLLQSGYVGFYIFMMVFGIIAILIFNLVIK
jgi:NADH-quinone oxidoreductase subunit L